MVGLGAEAGLGQESARIRTPVLQNDARIRTHDGMSAHAPYPPLHRTHTLQNDARIRTHVVGQQFLDFLVTIHIYLCRGGIGHA